MAKGGKQPGAGRPKGSTTRPQLRDDYTPKERAEFLKALKRQALVDPAIMKFVAEQIYGKAVQPLGNDETGVLRVTFDPAFKKDAASR